MSIEDRRFSGIAASRRMVSQWLAHGDVFRKRSDDMSTEEHESFSIRAHPRAIMSALSRLHVVFLSGQPLLFFFVAGKIS